MSKLESYLVTQAGIETEVGALGRTSTSGNFPEIGEIVLDPNERFTDSAGVEHFTLLNCTGIEVSPTKYPMYYREAEKVRAWQGFAGDISAQVGALQDFHLHSSGYYWALDSSPDQLVRYSPTWEYAGVTEDLSGIDVSCRGLTEDTDGYMYFVGAVTLAVHRVSPTGEYMGQVFSVSDLTNPRGLAIAADGSFWISDEGALAVPAGARIYVYSSVGTLLGEYNVSAEIEQIQAIAFDDLGHLWVGDFGDNSRLVEYDTDMIPTGDVVANGDLRGVDWVGTTLSSGKSTEQISDWVQTAVTPNMVSLDKTCPYKVIADLLGE